MWREEGEGMRALRLFSFIYIHLCVWRAEREEREGRKEKEGGMF